MKLLNESDFGKVWELMKLSFIDDELRPFEKHKALLHKDIYHIYGEWDSSEKNLISFIAIWDFEDFVFVDYFAVHPLHRNRKIGEKILSELKETTEKNICLEIDTPEDEISFRRLNFYKRNGFILCDFPYKHPPIAKGNNQVQLSIMSTQKISGIKQFNNICSTICHYAYEPFI